MKKLILSSLIAAMLVMFSACNTATEIQSIETKYEQTSHSSVPDENRNSTEEKTESEFEFSKTTGETKSVQEISESSAEPVSNNLNSDSSDVVSSNNSNVYPSNNFVKPRHIHSYTYKKVSPTCTNKGYESYTCSCGKNYKDHYVENTGHTWKKIKTVKAACSTSGYTLYKCSVCGETKQSNEKSASGHNWGSWKTTKNATTTSSGTKQHTCSVCGKTEEKTIARIKNENKYDKVATANDAKLISERTLYYINQYRSTKASMLPNMTQYAEYRAKQLTTNFAHDTTDERKAAKKLKYGEYVDPLSWGVTGREAYWEPSCGEAIGQGYGYTIDDVAKCLADGVHNSSGHWRYVGHSDNIYISIGVCHKGGIWYCCICTSNTNIYG